ncbi:MAG: 1-acyl-sn-glycerol-3-phosphate acyltransferase [Phycisphaerales bacterium]|nr:1-acyl-sn-glycerol-3-phosphate acyltransferase [Phycisphaerales bacterium]
MPAEPTDTPIFRSPDTRSELLVLRRRYAWKLRAADAFNRMLCRVWYRYRRIGPCTIPRDGPAIVTANHTCSADPMMIYAGCGYRKIAFMIAQEFADVPVGGWFVRLIECIPVRRDGRDAAATREAMRRIRDGHVISIFIQGRIAKPGQDVRPKEGVALLALRTGVPVIPVHISGNKYRDGIFAGLIARHRTRVRFGPPVDLSDFGGSTEGDNVQRATERIWSAIQQLSSNPST